MSTATLHRSSLRNAASLYLGLADRALPADGALLGLTEPAGSAFCFDPFAAYGSGRITNPNLLILGQVGSGKSALAKTLCWTQAALARRWVGILDPKGEYAPLAEALGLVTLRPGAGAASAVNPLASATVGAEAARHRAEAATALAVALADRALTGEETAGVSAAAAGLGQARLSALVEALLSPPASLAAELRVGRQALTGALREVGLQLRRLTEGDLAGLFSDRPGDAIATSGTGVVVDLSGLYARPELLSPAMVAAGAALSAALGDQGTQHVLVLDEAWLVLGNVGVVRWLRSTLKLARALGAAVVLVSHSLGDFDAVGSAGSESARVAAGLVADLSTQVVMAQPASAHPALRSVLRLGLAETEAAGRLRRGQGIWRIGAEAAVAVTHHLPAPLGPILDTDARMRAEPTRAAP